jgi:hypothetical protein
MDCGVDETHRAHQLGPIYDGQRPVKILVDGNEKQVSFKDVNVSSPFRDVFVVGFPVALICKPPPKKCAKNMHLAALWFI